VAGLLPGPALLHCGIQHVVGEWRDKPGVFGQGDELARWDQTVLGVLPAHQRLHPSTRPVWASTFGW
jgi:hypothetical protein